MIINRKLIRSPRRYLTQFKNGDQIRIGFPLESVSDKKLSKIGFTDRNNAGKRVLPSPNLSKYSYENSEGKFIKRKDLPMEKAERYWEWTWEDWGGNTHYDYRFIPYSRYRKEYEPPIALELTIGINTNGEYWVVTDPIKITNENLDILKLAMNLFLSIFKGFEILDVDLRIPVILTKTCDWEILRPGQKPETEIRRTIEKFVPKNKQKMYYRNTDKLILNNPNVVAIGTKGFNGYLVFEYPDKGIAVLESLMPNNATYILDLEWESLSKLTKSQVLNNELHIDRIYHYSSWDERISEYIA